MASSGNGVRIVVVGLGFGRSFVPIYQSHPNVERVGICDPNRALLDEFGDRFGVKDRFESLEEVLASNAYNAVHLLTPVPFHVDQTLAVLDSGKHCACAVPMATDLDDLTRIIETQQRTKQNYMMMETAVYSRAFLYVRALQAEGKLGNITFLRGAHFQDLEGDYPMYWRAQPPMHYATHAVAPLLALTNTRASRVCCLGAGKLREDLQQPGGTTFPLQTALFQLEGTDAVAEVTRSWFQTARSFTETFFVYGERMGFEWSQLEDVDPVVFTLDEERPKFKRNASAKRIQIPYRPDLFPQELAAFCAGDHGGSHPHLVHEFISSIVERRPPAIDAITSANWTAAGICANDSSLRNGEPIQVPGFG